jgi:hypothetical protein
MDDYKGQFSAYIECFTNHREQLDTLLTAGSYIQGLRTHENLAFLQTQVASLTKQEKDIQQFFDNLHIKIDNIEAKLDEKALRQLSFLSGESLEDLSGRDASFSEKNVYDKIGAFKASIMKDIRQDLRDIVKSNVSKLEATVKMLYEEQRQGVMLRSEARDMLIREMKSGVHDIIRDEVHSIMIRVKHMFMLHQVFRDLWESNGWKGSVKAVQFVLSLEEYLVTTQAEKKPTVKKHLSQPLSDEWAIDYLNFDHVRPILEAIDDDGTNYISVYEVNRFTNSKPEDWS